MYDVYSTMIHSQKFICIQCDRLPGTPHKSVCSYHWLPSFAKENRVAGMLDDSLNLHVLNINTDHQGDHSTIIEWAENYM